MCPAAARILGKIVLSGMTVDVTRPDTADELQPVGCPAEEVCEGVAWPVPEQLTSGIW